MNVFAFKINWYYLCQLWSHSRRATEVNSWWQKYLGALDLLLNLVRCAWEEFSNVNLHSWRSAFLVVIPSFYTCRRNVSSAQLCADKPGRLFVKEKKTYLIIRELHRWEIKNKEEDNAEACEKLIQVILRRRVLRQWTHCLFPDERKLFFQVLFSRVVSICACWEIFAASIL